MALSTSSIEQQSAALSPLPSRFSFDRFSVLSSLSSCSSSSYFMLFPCMLAHPVDKQLHVNLKNFVRLLASIFERHLACSKNLPRQTSSFLGLTSGGLQINDIESFCQDAIVLYLECAKKRDKELRRRFSDSEHILGLSMPIEEAKERAAQCQSEVTSLERQMILASGIQGMEGFNQRWSLHGHLEDTDYLSNFFFPNRGLKDRYAYNSRRRLEALNQGIKKRKADMIQGEPKRDPVRKKWSFGRICLLPCDFECHKSSSYGLMKASPPPPTLTKHAKSTLNSGLVQLAVKKAMEFFSSRKATPSLWKEEGLCCKH
ncbi:hypothetical protein OPV22_010950 [Ensete ventricosum]|uniref:DUF7803 domain-containing protein n=1 Tax=Ensete ventricosum TaxID=4639 RepID=A0AAV8RMD7_ENSVE|nr:hypothetical protein OPV22_010950 [Ensete ventricosum]